jgi:uncharacterized protein (DUF1015 family)
MHIQPIRATRYSVADVSKLIIPPYDAISPEQVPVFLSRSPYNLAHVLLPDSADPGYKNAGTKLRHWVDSGTLVEDAFERFFLYRQRFEIEGVTHVRDSLMCAVELDDFSEGHVRPHENTYGKYKADRLNIMRGTGYQLSHVFGMVRDSEGVLSEFFERWSYGKPLSFGGSGDGVEHFLWGVSAPDYGARINEFFGSRPIYIVDGHHRYSSALAYARELGTLGTAHPSAQVLFCIVNAFDPSVLVFPTHRIVKKISVEKLDEILSRFSTTEISESELESFVRKPQKEARFVVCFKGRLLLCEPGVLLRAPSGWGESVAQLAVAWSDWQLLESLGVDESNRADIVTYERSFEVAWAERPHASLIIFHGPTPIDRVCEVADEGQFMPQKTTYFYPKLAAGFVLRRIGA